MGCLVGLGRILIVIINIIFLVSFEVFLEREKERERGGSSVRCSLTWPHSYFQRNSYASIMRVLVTQPMVLIQTRLSQSIDLIIIHCVIYYN